MFGVRGKSYKKPNANYRYDFNKGANTASSVKKAFFRSIHKWLSEDDVELLSRRQIALFINGTADIKQCGKCKNYYVVNTKEFFATARSNLARWGYQFKCWYCRTGKWESFDEARSKILARIKEHIATEIDRATGVSTEDNLTIS